jgi:site-specific DNA-methyltransferase (adenine-specific)
MAMFPPALPHYFIRWLTKPGEIVYDPFSGRGTTLLEAGLLHRRGLGSDANPLAWILSSAKAQPCSREQLHSRIRQLKRLRRRDSIASVPNHVQALFSASVLAQLQAIRRQLNTRNQTDRFLLATLCGILHANARKDGTPRGLTVAMPNTFAMAPGYVARYIAEHKLVAPDVDVLDALSARVDGIDLPDATFVRGKAWIQDAARLHRWPVSMPKASLVLTSPPYLEVMKYGKLNWIRSWLIGQDPKTIDRQLFASSSLPKYLAFMTDVFTRIRSAMRPDGWVCVVIGDVRQERGNVNLAQHVIDYCVPRTDFRFMGTIADDVPIEHKVSRIWGATRGHATKTDRIIILGGPKAGELPMAPTIDWRQTLPQEAIA